MIHLGDITKIDGSKILPVDVIIGGSPCQDLSIAGKREGLSGERSGLFMEQIRIIKENHKEYGTDYPRFMVWENVPGALSSNKGEDFRIVLEETAKIAEADAVIPRPPQGKWKNSGCIMGDGWSIAWRILDAQFWGVPQRRRRIALVADFGGESAPEILFEREGVSGYTPQGFRSWQGAAGASEKGSRTAGCVCLNDQGGSRMDVTEDVAATLRAESHGHPPCVMRAAGFCTEHSAQSRSIGYEEETSPTLRAGTVPGVVYENHSQDTRHTGSLETAPTVMCMAHGQANAEILRNLSPTLNCDHEQPIVMSVHQNGDGEVGTGEVANTLNTNSNASGRNAPVIFENNGNSGYRQGVGTLKSSGGDCGRGSKNLCVSCLTGWDRQARRVYRDQGIMSALSAREVSGQNQQAVLTKGTVAGFNGHKSITGSIQYREDTAPTLESNMPGNVLKEIIVRRLTPLECERLQGFPDGWTDIGDYIDSKGKKKHTADTARYRALGNSIALPPWRWVLKRLCNQYDRCVTMGSLFDGIGGFPLIWEEINGKGSCLWASEIEEFPIAVTKIRFSE